MKKPYNYFLNFSEKWISVFISANQILYAILAIFILLLPYNSFCNRNLSNNQWSLFLSVVKNNISHEYLDVSADLNGNIIYKIGYNGRINISVSGGLAPYFIYCADAYSSLATDSSAYFSNLPPGSYKFTISDLNGFSKDTTIELKTMYPQPTISFGKQFPSSCTTNDGSIELSASGGTPPYSFSIDGGVTFSTNSVFSNLLQGNYPMLIVKDANGFLAFTGFNPNPNLNNYFTPPDGCLFNFNVYPKQPSTCSDNLGTVTAKSIGGKMPTLYSLDNLNYKTGILEHYANGDSAYVIDFNNLGPGLYHVYGKDTLGNLSIHAVEIIKVCNISVSYVSIDAACNANDGSIAVTAVNGVAPYRYSLDGINFQTSNIFNGLPAGYYSVLAIDANDVTSTTTAVVYDKCPIVTASVKNSDCDESNGSIIANGEKGTAPYLFSIDGVNFNSDNEFINLPENIYNVFVKDSKGFISSTIVEIRNNCLLVDIKTKNAICNGSNGSISIAIMNGTAPYQYSIDGVSFQEDNEFFDMSAGSYFVEVRDALGLSHREEILISRTPMPEIKVEVTSASCENTNGTISLNSNFGEQPFQYSIDNGNSFQSGHVFDKLDSATYLTVIKDANGCISTKEVQLKALPTPAVFLGNDTTLCEGDKLILELPFVEGNIYTWEDNQNGVRRIITHSGNYSVNVMNRFGCMANSEISAIFQPIPKFSIGGDTVLCSGIPFLVQATPSLNGSYLWNTGSSDNFLIIKSPGTYWLQISNNGCSSKESIKVEYKPIPTVQIGNDTILCEGKTVVLNATNNNSTYLWQDGSKSSTYVVSEAGKFSVIVDQEGCKDSDVINIFYNKKPEVMLPSDTTICNTQYINLDAYFDNSTYLWGDGTTSSFYKVTKGGNYTVKVTNLCGTTEKSINVMTRNCSCKFFVPNAFTPNGDGRNDTFVLTQRCLFDEYKLVVYNRFGQLVFETSNPNKSWDGSMNGVNLPAGTYIWVLKYRDKLTGFFENEKGTTILIR